MINKIYNPLTCFSIPQRIISRKSGEIFGYHDSCSRENIFWFYSGNNIDPIFHCLWPFGTVTQSNTGNFEYKGLFLKTSGISHNKQSVLLENEKIQKAHWVKTVY